MPTARNWGVFIYINAAFAALIALVFYYSSMNDIKANWAQYRCNPMYMPFSDNLEQDFQYCVQNTQSNFMGYILQPITYVTSNLAASSAAVTGDIQNIRGMFDKVRTFMSTAVQQIFGVFLNLIIEFQRITISIKDLMGKTIGIMVTVMYMMDGSVKTMQSVNNGPPGQMLRSLGKCFHPNTRVELAVGTCIDMCDVKPGMVLLGGDVVTGVLRFPNLRDQPGYEPLYCLAAAGCGGADIYATGSHHIFAGLGCSGVQRHVAIRNWPDAVAQDAVTTAQLVCLVTDTHQIRIGSRYVFCDYTV